MLGTAEPVFRGDGSGWDGVRGCREKEVVEGSKGEAGRCTAG